MLFYILIIVVVLLLAAVWSRAGKEKITAGTPDDKFVIYWSPDCKYCVKALALLREQRAMHADVMITDFPALLKKMQGRIPASHKTKPIIFLNGKFLGGYTDLAKYFGVPAV